MRKALGNAAAATALIGLSCYVWRIAYAFGDWAILAFVPLSIFVYLGAWTLALNPWKAKLRIELRDESPLSRILTGRIRAAFLSAAFASIAILLLAWRTLVASALEGAIMLLLVFVAGAVFALTERLLAPHFRQPFARAIAVSCTTWAVAAPFYLFIAFETWAYASQPGTILEATFTEALRIGIDTMPGRRGFLAELLAVPYAYEAAKLWVVVQLRDYPVIGILFSLDAAVFSFVLARAGIVLTQFVGSQRRAEPA